MGGCPRRMSIAPRYSWIAAQLRLFRIWGALQRTVPCARIAETEKTRAGGAPPWAVRYHSPAHRDLRDGGAGLYAENQRNGKTKRGGYYTGVVL